MVADVGDRAQRDDPARGRRPPAADAGDQPVALGDRDQRPPRRLGHVGVVGVADDRRERAVDVEQDRGAPGSARSGARTSSRVAAGGTRLSSQHAAPMTRRRPGRATDLAPRRHRRPARGAVQRPVRRRRRDGHRAAARALARLRDARGDRHVAGRDRPDRRGRDAPPRAPTATSTSTTACSSACPRSAACSAGTWLQQRDHPRDGLAAVRRAAGRPPRSSCCVAHDRGRDPRRLRRRASWPGCSASAAGSCSSRRSCSSSGSAQVDAEATSLLAIIPVALVGAWRQHRYGNVRAARRRSCSACSRSRARSAAWRSSTRSPSAPSR